MVWYKTEATAQANNDGYCCTVFLAYKVVDKCGVIYSMLSTPEAASDVFYDPQDGVLAGLSPGKSLVDCATLQVEVRWCLRHFGEPVYPGQSLFYETL